MATFLKTTEISIDGARTLPREYYTSPALFAEELERIFTKRWLCVDEPKSNTADWKPRNSMISGPLFYPRDPECPSWIRPGQGESD